MQLPSITTFILGSATVASAFSASPAAIIEEIAPGSKTCASNNDECRTAEQAAPHIFSSMLQYGLTCPSQMASVIALMAFESVDFAYKTNQYPGRPGQGTANMQMAAFNLLYAKSIDAVSDDVANVTSIDGLSDDELNRIRGLVTPDKYNFGSGAWFLKTQCGDDVITALRENVDTGFEAHMACVGVTVDEDRLAYLERAKSAFGL